MLEQALARDLRDRHVLGVGALEVEAHQLVVRGRCARCRSGTGGSGRSTASRCSARRRRPRRAARRARRGRSRCTSPEISWPSTHGASIRRSPLKKTRTSVPQMPVAGTRSSTPSARAGGVGDRAEGHLAGPCQIAARTPCSSCRTTCRPADYTLRHVGVHLHAHAQRHDAGGCARHLRLDRGHRPAARRLQGRRPAAGRARAFMDEIRANGHTSYLEVVSETEEATLRSARGGRRRSAPTT